MQEIDCCRLARHNHHDQVQEASRISVCVHVTVFLGFFGSLPNSSKICAWTGWFALGCGGQLSWAESWTSQVQDFLCLRLSSLQFYMPWLEPGILKGAAPRSSGERLQLD